jgi:hypothetical protein
MTHMKRNGMLAFALAFGFTAWSSRAANPAIAVVSSHSSYFIDSSTASGNTDLHQGSELKTGKDPGRLVLSNGADAMVSGRSSTTVYRDRLVLETGSVRLTKFGGYPLEVRQLRIEADSPNSEVLVRAKGETVEVASLENDVRVVAGAVPLTRVAAGTRMTFKPSKAPDSTTTQYETHLASDRHVLYWYIGIIAGAAIIIGSIAIAQGKSL